LVRVTFCVPRNPKT
jgi:hypothetical protein